MRAVVTEGVGAMAVTDRPDPPSPGPGEVLVAPDATGICGSDYHFFTGELSDEAGGSQFPRVQGHEVSGTIAELGPGCRPELATGQRVALWPLHACGECYPCSVRRFNTCDNFQLIGIHVDGGLQERLIMREDHVFPISSDDPAVASMAEPVSIAVRAVHRGRVTEGERVVVLGAGPIGQALLLAAQDRGASVVVVDLLESRLELARSLGAETLLWTSADEVVARLRRERAPEVVIDATGVPAAVRAAVELVSSAGRVVQVGMSGDEVTFRLGSFTEKELDVLGVACCGSTEFGEAVDLVERNADRLAPLVSHEFDLAEAPDAVRFAMERPADVMKVVIRGDRT